MNDQNDVNTCTIADLLVHYLECLDIEYVFSVPGGAIQPLTTALAIKEKQNGIRAIVARHEAGAGAMADGYFRETGKIGVCCATSGPGATNLLTAMACAADNDIPILAITGQPAQSVHGKRALQESSCTGINIMTMFNPCTKYNTAITHPDQAQTKILGALSALHQYPRKPVHLSIPVDLMGAVIHPTPMSKEQVQQLCRPVEYGMSGYLADGISAVLDTLYQTTNRCIIIGRNCERVMPWIMQFIERIGLDFVVTPDAKGLVSTTHPHFQGVFGFAGHSNADQVLANSHLILAAGVRMGEWTSGAWNKHLMSSKTIHIDETPQFIAELPFASQHLIGSLSEIFACLAYDILPITNKVSDYTFVSPAIVANPSGTITPQELMISLADIVHVMSHPMRFYTDAGNSTPWAIHYLNPKVSNTSCWFNTTMDFAPMGWAIGAAVGAATAHRSAITVCITGDGSYLMNGQEITVAQQENLPVVFVILNDSALGMVKHGQRLSSAAPSQYELPVINYKDMAASMGIDAYVINSVNDFDATLCERINDVSSGPLLLDVRIDSEQVPPIKLRIKTIAN